jgi:Family of unknown function (DUF5994)
MTSQTVNVSADLLTVRLYMRPAEATSGRVMDGAWWPRSGDPAAELSFMIPVLDQWRDEVMMVSLSAGGWLRCPTRLRVEDRDLRLHWLGLYRDLLIATAVSSRQVRLLVIPPATGECVAMSAVTIALDPNNHAPAPGILARAIYQRFWA